MNCVGENVTQLCGRPQVFLRKWLWSVQKGIQGTGQGVKGGMFRVVSVQQISRSHALFLAHDSGLLISCVVLGALF